MSAPSTGPLEGRDASELVAIWSGEHGAYWRPKRGGYTTSVLGAGLYDRAEAEAIVRGSGPEKAVKVVPWAELPIPDDAGTVLSALRSQPVVEGNDAQLLEIAERIRTQDNRATGAPIFAVQERVRDYGYDPDYSDTYVWIDVGNDHTLATPEEAAALDAGSMDPDGWTRTAYRDRWEFVTACFTEAGCEEYIRVNGHNLTDPRIYVYSAHRNAEWKFLRSWMSALRSLPHAEPGEALDKLLSDAAKWAAKTIVPHSDPDCHRCGQCGVLLPANDHALDCAFPLVLALSDRLAAVASPEPVGEPGEADLEAFVEFLEDLDKHAADDKPLCILEWCFRRAALSRSPGAVDWHESYRVLAEAVEEHLSAFVIDDDVAEMAIYEEAIKSAGKALAARSPGGQSAERQTERIAQITAHRVCIGLEHDPANGKLHGHCVVCGVPWPCSYAGSPGGTTEPSEGELADRFAFASGYGCGWADRRDGNPMDPASAFQRLVGSLGEIAAPGGTEGDEHGR